MNSYLNSEGKISKILIDFLNNGLSATYLFLVHSAQYLVSNRIMQTERSANSVIEVLHCFRELVECIKREVTKFYHCKCQGCS